MFLSITNSFSVQTLCRGQKRRWIPIADKTELRGYLRNMGEDTIYRVAGINYLGNPEYVTHRYCERMIWGNEAFGRGLKDG